MAAPIPRSDTQLSTNLPGISRHITSFDKVGKSVFTSSSPARWLPVFGGQMAFSAIYTTSGTPVDINDERDIKLHEDLISQGKLQMTNPEGTLARVVDFGPGAPVVLHRTQSVDYAVILEGEFEYSLDNGESKVMQRGDITVQRASSHAWKNISKDGWGRIFFVLIGSVEPKVNGKALGEDLTEAGDELSKLDKQ